MTQENTENGQWSGDGAMDSTTLDQDADAANRAWPGIGQELRLTRESAGHSLEAVAETLRIQAQHLHERCVLGQNVARSGQKSVGKFTFRR